MPEADLLALFAAPLNRAGIAYMISGSLASTLYGEPRATLDVDIALILQADDVPRLVQCFPAEEYYVPPVEVIDIEVRRAARGHFNVIHSGTGLKADFYPSRNHPCFPWAVKHRRHLTVGGMEIWVAPPEYVILWKLEFYREGGGEKHLQDIRAILEVQSESLNATYVTEFAGRLGLASCWEKAQSTDT